jgi:hypothetical protein
MSVRSGYRTVRELLLIVGDHNRSAATVDLPLLVFVEPTK